MYYGENVFVSHYSAAPIYYKGFTYIFGKILYSIKQHDELVFYYRDKTITAVSEGVIPVNFVCTAGIYTPLSPELIDKIYSAINSPIADRYKIEYPYEEKYVLLVLRGDIQFDAGTVWAKKAFFPKYGEAVFETAMQEWLTMGCKYIKINGKAIEVIGTVLKNLRIGEKLMLVSHNSESTPSEFIIRKIIFRGNSVNEADPSMRVYTLSLEGDDIHIGERALFVKV